MRVGIAGEFRCVVTKADGTIKTDTKYQRNLILNQGLDFFGGGKGSAANQACVIGAGNTIPAINQNSLANVVSIAVGTNATFDTSYSPNPDNLYKMWSQNRYRFEGLDNVNISEVGLVSSTVAGVSYGITTSNYYLTTRALIKDALGNPTSITILLGETLDIYYKLHKVVSVLEQSYIVNMLDGVGGSVPYNVVIKPAHVGQSTWESGLTSAAGSLSNTASPINFTNTELVDVVSYPAAGATLGGDAIWKDSAYVTGTYKKVFTLAVPLDALNNFPFKIVSFFPYPGAATLGYSFLPFQARFGRVSDDAPITKTNKEKLDMPFEVSWGRYEGDL